MTAARVLIVEDNDVYRSTLELLLGMRSEIAIVASAADATEALHALEVTCPDVVVVDLRLPGMNGVELIERVRGCEPTIGAVCLTAEATVEEERALAAAGANALVRKSAPVDEIVGAIVRAASPEPT